MKIHSSVTGGLFFTRVRPVFFSPIRPVHAIRNVRMFCVFDLNASLSQALQLEVR
jgi:hypothetical protein